MDLVVDVDERRRLSLGKLGRAEHKRYLAHEEPDGTIVLTPAVVITEAQYQLMANPGLVSEMEQAAADPSSRVRRGRPQRKD
jgi:hypothetical protein